jgi:hypothetical protein
VTEQITHGVMGEERHSGVREHPEDSRGEAAVEIAPFRLGGHMAANLP